MRADCHVSEVICVLIVCDNTQVSQTMIVLAQGYMKMQLTSLM